jgi:hypothetical protein
MRAVGCGAVERDAVRRSDNTTTWRNVNGSMETIQRASGGRIRELFPRGNMSVFLYCIQNLVVVQQFEKTEKRKC